MLRLALKRIQGARHPDGDAVLPVEEPRGHGRAVLLLLELRAAAEDYPAYGRRLRAKILRWVGIPCGVGFAPTKTLAKIANHIGKKRPEGVFLMPDDPTEILASLPVEEVWGVGRRLPVKLRAVRILTTISIIRLFPV